MDDLTESRPRDILWFRDSPFMRNRPFEVIGIGSPDWMKPRMIDRPNGTADYLFMYFPTPVQVRHAGILRDFPPGSFFLWTPGNRHNFGNPDQLWCHWWLHAKGEFVERAIRNSSIPCNVPIQLETPGLFPGLLRPIYDELNESVQFDYAVLEARFMLLVRLLDRALHPRPVQGHIPERIARVIRRMTDNPAVSPATLPELARIAGLSVSRFSAEFRATTGMPPIRFLLEKKMELAAYLLRDRNLRVSEAAEQAGFHDPLYFSRLFRRKYGLTPVSFRRRVEAGLQP